MIAVINPPQVFSRTMTAAGVVPPIGCAYLAAVLRAHGHRVELIDAVVEGADQTRPGGDGTLVRGLSFEAISKRLEGERPRLIGISNLFSFAFPVVRRLARHLKQRFPEVPIVLGGAHPSAVPAEVLREPSIDVVVISEGERSILALLERLENGRGLFDVDGVAFRAGSRIVVNPKRDYLSEDELDRLPFPAFDLLPLEAYHRLRESHGITSGRWLPLISSRGCPYDCTFCTPQLWGRRYRARSAANVLAEMRHFHETLGIREFHFEDENLTLRKRRMLDLCAGIPLIDPQIRWQAPNGIRASVTDAETLQAMYDSGCRHLTVAPESGSRRVLEEIIHKEQDLEAVSRVVEEAHRIGMRTLAYFILGLPGEKPAEVRKTISYGLELGRRGLDEVVYTNYLPLPGSHLFEQLTRGARAPGIDYFDSVEIGDLGRSTSWNDDLSSRALARYRLLGYASFHLEKALLRPSSVARSLWNIARGRQELKSERAARTLIERMIGR